MANYTVSRIQLPNGDICNLKNTTYTFSGGINSFTVTPLDGSTQTITVTPNITNNITGSGTNNYLAKFNGTNTITAGPSLGNDTTRFLRNDGTWQKALTEHQDIEVSGTLSSGTQIGIISIDGEETPIYTPNAAPMTIQVTQSSNTPTAEFVMSTNTETSTELTGVLGSTTAIANGKIIYYMTRYALPNEEVTLTLRYASSNSYTAAIPIYSYGTMRCVTPYPASYVLTLIYYDNAFYIASSNLAIVG